MKTTLKSFTLAATVSLLAATPGYASEKVNIGVPSWTGAQAIAHLLAAVVEIHGDSQCFLQGPNLSFILPIGLGSQR